MVSILRTLSRKTFAILLLICTSTDAQGQIHKKMKARLLCQGEYSGMGKDANGNMRLVKMDHWRMYAMSDGTYSVVVDVIPEQLKPEAPNLIFEESYIFTSKLKPKVFNLNMSNRNGDDSISTKIRCDYSPAKLNCHMAYHTRDESVSDASDTMTQRMPYTFWPSVEAPKFDIPWAFQSFAIQAARSIGHKTTIPLISIDDGDSESSMKLTIEETEQVEYLGWETIEVLNQQVHAHKFRIIDPYDQEEDL